jgi:hypothetical protein
MGKRFTAFIILCLIILPQAVTARYNRGNHGHFHPRRRPIHHHHHHTHIYRPRGGWGIGGPSWYNWDGGWWAWGGGPWGYPPGYCYGAPCVSFGIGVGIGTCPGYGGWYY